VGCVPGDSRFQQGWGFGLWMEGYLGGIRGLGLIWSGVGGVGFCTVASLGGIVEEEVLRFAREENICGDGLKLSSFRGGENCHKFLIWLCLSDYFGIALNYWGNL